MVGARVLFLRLLVCVITPAIVAVPKDVSHIQCAVCKQAVKEASGRSKEQELSDEDALSDLVENLCTARTDEGKWTMKIDVVQKPNQPQLSLDRREEEGVCRKECKSVQRACSVALKGREDDLVSMLRDNAGVGKLQREFCKKPCDKKIPELGQWKDESFEPSSPTPSPTPSPDPSPAKSPVTAFADFVLDVIAALLGYFGREAEGISSCYNTASAASFLEELHLGIEELYGKTLDAVRSALGRIARAINTMALAVGEHCPQHGESAGKLLALSEKLESSCKGDNALEYKAMEVLKVDGHDVHKQINAVVAAWRMPDGKADPQALGTALGKFFEALDGEAEGGNDRPEL